MTYKDLKNQIKEEQKELALKIRNGKSGRKPSRLTDLNSNDYFNLEHNQSYYRHRHIMYCHFFNKTPYDAIEQPRDDNSPSSYQLKKFEIEWESLLDEDVRDCS
jgi:hypothetical protein